jgi:hypothetical protein
MLDRDDKCKLITTLRRKCDRRNDNVVDVNIRESTYVTTSHEMYVLRNTKPRSDPRILNSSQLVVSVNPMESHFWLLLAIVRTL